MYDNIIIGQSTRGVRGMNKRIISFVLVICMISTCLTNVFYKEVAYAENVIQETDQGESSEENEDGIEPDVCVCTGSGIRVECYGLEEAVSMVEDCDSAIIELLSDVTLEKPLQIDLQKETTKLTIELEQHILKGNLDGVDIEFGRGCFRIRNGKLTGNIQVEKEGVVYGENVTFRSEEPDVPAIGVHGVYHMMNNTMVRGKQGIHIFSDGGAQLIDGKIVSNNGTDSSESVSYEILMDDGFLADLLPKDKSLYVNGPCYWVDPYIYMLDAVKIGDVSYKGVQIIDAPLYLSGELEEQTATYGEAIELHLDYTLCMGDLSDVSVECFEIDSQGEKQLIESEERVEEESVSVKLKKIYAGEHEVYVRLLWQGGVYVSNVKTVDIHVDKKRLTKSDFVFASDNVYEKEYDGNKTCDTVNVVIKEGVVWNTTPIPLTGTATYHWAEPDKKENYISCVTQRIYSPNYYTDSVYSFVEEAAITKREVTIALKGSVRKCYDGMATLTNVVRNTLYLELGNVIEGEDVQAEARVYEFEDASIGYTKKVYARICYLTGEDKEHYTLSQDSVCSNVGAIYAGVVVSATPEPMKTPIPVTPVPTKTPIPVTPEPTKTPILVTPEPTKTPILVTPEPTKTPIVVTPIPTKTPVVTMRPTETPVLVTPIVTIPAETANPTVSPIVADTPFEEDDFMEDGDAQITQTPVVENRETFVPVNQTENPSYDEEFEYEEDYESLMPVETKNPVITSAPEENEMIEEEDEFEEVLVTQSGKSYVVGTTKSELEDDLIDEGEEIIVGDDSEDVIELGELPKKGWIIKSKNGCFYKITKKGENVTFVKPKGKNMVAYTIPNTVMIDDVQYDVTGIQKNALKNSKRLQVLTIGKNVKEIGSGAFANCTKLKTVIINAKKIKKGKVSKGTFSGIGPRTTVYVPKGKYKTYKKLFTSLGCKGQVKKE